VGGNCCKLLKGNKWRKVWVVVVMIIGYWLYDVLLVCCVEVW